jgi:hypothetical protein
MPRWYVFVLVAVAVVAWVGTLMGYAKQIAVLGIWLLILGLLGGMISYVRYVVGKRG